MGDMRQFEFRIIAGELKGRKITAPDLGITRPPLTRLRRSIFDYLNPWLGGAEYLDLFSGTGSYLFEAVSRGARHAVGVEMEPLLAESINAQAERLGVADRLVCLEADVFASVPNLAARGQRFDIVMIAPPQYRGFVDRTLMLLAADDLLKSNGQIICQHDTSETLSNDRGLFHIDQQRKYGNTTFTILRRL
jgi:16S rRNA (guanine966-N2)-methyltransferase